MLRDYQTAPISEALKRALTLARKLTLEPQSFGPADLEPLRELGVSDEQIEDAIVICADFNVINRVADSLGFEPSTAGAYRRQSRQILRLGYDL